MPNPLPDAEVPRALVVGAHPDDIDFGAAGTVARWTRAGTRVTYLVLTHGEQGGLDDTPRDEIPRIREAEQRAAAKPVGVDDVRFLTGYRDGYVEVTHDLVRDITRVIRQTRPVRVLAQSPERWWDRFPASHHDHLAAGEATVRAVYPAARNPFAYPELLDDGGLEPWTVRELWLAAHPTPDHVVDITDTLDAKFAALAAHASQTSHSMDDIRRMFRGSLARAARSSGLGEGRFAEEFKVVYTG
ncbi:MAG: PIG-L deacetylase family protein [Actinomycetes bacterium]